MVERLVGEVSNRSYKEGSRAQPTQVSRDKDIHEAFDLEASWSFFFSPFTKGTAYIPLWQSDVGKNRLKKKHICGGTAYL